MVREKLGGEMFHIHFYGVLMKDRECLIYPRGIKMAIAHGNSRNDIIVLPWSAESRISYSYQANLSLPILAILYENYQ